jgi:glycine/D-amino acid oxidase-like deaminating enzyme
MTDVIVVGGGIIGAASALELTRAGARVTLVERDELAAGASGRNQGWLVTPEDPANLPLHAPSLARYLEAADRAPIPAWIDRDPIGYLLVALDGDEIEPGEIPEGAQALDAPTTRALEPALSPGIGGGWLIADGGRRVDPAALTVGLALLAREAGATIRHHLTARSFTTTGDRVTGIVTDDGILQAETVVMAAGPWSNDILGRIGVHLPLWSARGWIVRTRPSRPLVARLVERVGWRRTVWHGDAVTPMSAQRFVDDGVHAAGGALLNPHPDGSVLVGSSREVATGPEPGDPGIVARQIADAIQIAPALADAALESSWWGVRPMSPDDRPLIGAVRDGLVVATGHGSEGIILGQGTAELVRALVLGEAPAVDPAPFDPSRFPSFPPPEAAR